MSKRSAKRKAPTRRVRSKGLLSGRLASPYGQMAVCSGWAHDSGNVQVFFNGARVLREKLVGAKYPHTVPKHWIAR